jgi:replicative DNA helicase Mcm
VLYLFLLTLPYLTLPYLTLPYLTLPYLYHTQKKKKKKKKKNDTTHIKKKTKGGMITIYPTDQERLEKILQETHNNQLVTNTGTFNLNYQILHTYYYEYAEAILENPQIEIPLLQETIKTLSIQPIKHIQINNIPTTPIRQIHSKQYGQLLSFEGNVKKTRTVYNQIQTAAWDCNHCGQTTTQQLTYDSKVTPPKQKCPYCDNKKGYTLNTNKTTFKDVQLFTVQERLEEVQRGFQPVNIKCYLTGNMIQTTKPGDKIRVTGVIDLRNTNNNNRFTEYCLVDHIDFLERNFEDVVITAEDEKNITTLAAEGNVIQKLSESIVPTLHGYSELKKALLLQLASSDKIIHKDGSTQRGDIHILLVGDPGIGKSKLLQGVSQLAPRGVFTSGKSSSGAGLTAAAVKDVDDTWTLEAGAMVLADGGQVCIDEFDKMSENDRSAIHEALEQQTISIAKAGMNTTLHSQCSVLAAANPKFGNFDDTKDTLEQIKLSTPLLSRFDLIFILKDIVDEDHDLFLADSILNMELQVEEKYSNEFIRKYLSFARRNHSPEMTVEANNMIKDFFVKWREHTKFQQSKANTRQLFALIRLSKASARLRLSDVVTVEDVQLAIDIETYCINSGGDIELSATVVDRVHANEARIDELMRKQVEELKIDYNNNIPHSILKKQLCLVSGKSKESVDKWLRQEDELEHLLFDQVMQTWSVRG